MRFPTAAQDRLMDRSQALALEESVDPEARHAGNRVCEVEAALRLEVLLLLRRDDAIDERANLLRCELVVVVKPLEPPVDADNRMRPCCHVEVGGVAIDHHLEQLVD